MKFEDVETVHQFMVQQVAENGGKIDKVYFCPQLKSVPDNYRKPSPKMAYFAKNDFPDIGPPFFQKKQKGQSRHPEIPSGGRSRHRNG